MYENNMVYLNTKLEAIEESMATIESIIPATKGKKLKLNAFDKHREYCLKLFKISCELTNVRRVAPVENYDILFEAVKILEKGRIEILNLKTLCIYADTIEFNTRVQEEFAEAVRASNRDKCLLIIGEERRRSAAAEETKRFLELKVEKAEFNKNVTKIVNIISTYLDEDGRPVNKKINLGLMNSYLRKIYEKDEILEAYKQYLDTEPYNLLMKMINRDLDKHSK